MGTGKPINKGRKLETYKVGQKEERGKRINKFMTKELNEPRQKEEREKE